MPGLAHNQQDDNPQIVLDLLTSVDRDGAQSQRKLAADLGIALGLVNAYLKRCVTKGLVKMGEAPTRRYAYYLTPKGFAEKSRLTIEYLSSSFSFFRHAKADCLDVLNDARGRGWTRVALLGVSDLAEIATICAVEAEMTIVAVVDPASRKSQFVGLTVVRSIEEIDGAVDAFVVTDLKESFETAEAAAAKAGEARVLAPALLGLSATKEQRDA